MAEENQGSFKVTDRRLFNADGTLREDALIEERAPAPTPTPEPQPTTSAGSGQSQRQFAAATAPEL